MPALDYTFVLGETYGIDVLWADAAVVWSVSIVADTPLQAHDADEYAGMLSALLPTGAAWPRSPETALMKLLRSLAEEMARVESRAALLLAETDPATTTELLPDWERVVGLPDPCVTQAQTVAERRAALAGRITAIGGQSVAFFVQLAARLGYEVTIDEFRSADEATAAGVLFVGDEWAHIWRVNVPTTVGITPFMVGSGSVGEPLRAWSNEVLECQFNRFKPAHTRVLFAYAG